MALSGAAATASGRAAGSLYVNRKGVVAASAASFVVGTFSRQAASAMARRVGSRGWCQSTSSSIPMAFGQRTRTVAQSSLKLQQRLQEQNKKSYDTFVYYLGRETQAVTSLRRGVVKERKPVAVAQTEFILSAAAGATVAPEVWTSVGDPHRTEGWSAERLAAGSLFLQRTAGCVRTPATPAGSKDAGGLTAPPAGEEGSREVAAFSHGSVHAVHFAARLRRAVSTVTPTPAAFKGVTAVDKSSNKYMRDKILSCVSSATATRQPPCKIGQTFELMHLEARKALHEVPWMPQMRCAYTAPVTTAPVCPLGTQCSLKSTRTNKVYSQSALVFPPPADQRYHRRFVVLLAHAAFAATPCTAAAMPGGSGARQRAVRGHSSLSCPAVGAAVPTVNLFTVAARGHVGVAASEPAFLPVVYGSVKSLAASDFQKYLDRTRVPARVMSLGNPGVAAVRRSLSSASASAATGTASAGADDAAVGGGAASPGGVSTKVVATVPLGNLYSKTHEYVRLLLEFVEAIEGSGSGGAAAVASEEESKGKGAAADTGGARPRHCRLVGYVGISAHAAEELGEVVYCEYTRPLAAAGAAAAKTEDGPSVAAAQQRRSPKRLRARAGRGTQAALKAEEAIGKAEAGAAEEKMWVRSGGPICSLESVKSVAEIYSPVEGVVLEINSAAAEKPALVWRQSEGDGWLVKLLLPLPAGKASGNNNDDEMKPVAYALHLSEGDVTAAPSGGTPVSPEESAAGDAPLDIQEFMQACRNCIGLQDALLGLRRRLMGPDQYMQFVEREKKATGGDT